MYVLYSLLLAVAMIISLPWWAFQVLRRRKYRIGLKERLGFVPSRLRGQAAGASRAIVIWIHAVSVGEVLAISQLAARLGQGDPRRRIFISTTTATGQRLARQRFGQTQVFFMPLDFRFAIRHYLELLRPRLLILAETELWPNLLRLAREASVRVAMVNARVSDRSFPRYRQWRWFFSRVLSYVDMFLAQTDEDARRLEMMGAAPQRVQVSGNLKFDVSEDGGSRLASELWQALGKNQESSPRVLVCGSTTEGEEDLLLETFAELLEEFPSTMMMIAPRHPERFAGVGGLIVSRRFTLIQRSRWTGGWLPPGSVFLLDSVGELASVYALADVAFVGGSLLPGVGGHNILEPARYGVPIVVGPYVSNFREIISIFERGAAIRLVTAEGLTGTLRDLLRDDEERRRLGYLARELFFQNTGATERTLRVLESLLHQSGIDP